MIEIFVKRPATTIILILFFVLLGFVSYFNLNVEKQPRIDFPLVTVNVTYPGASPIEVETQILKKIEDAVVEVSAIESMKSRAFENFGYVLIEFDLSADVNVKSSEVKDKVDGIINDLPEDIDKPIVERVDPFATSVVELVLESEKLSGKDLFEYADKKLKTQFTKVSGVGSVDVFGGEEREIRIEADPVLMKERYISLSNIAEAISLQNLNVPIGTIDRTKTSLSLRYVGEFENLQQIRDLPLNNVEGGKFKLSDVAKVYDGAKEIEYLSRFNGTNAVTLSVKKISDGNEVQVVEGVLELLPEIKKTLPEGVKLSVASETASFITNETNSTLQGIGLGIILTVLIIFLFSGNVKMTIIAAIVIPASIISSLLLMDFSNFTINFITLLSMATSLGTLIANAIVIIESVLVYLKQGADPKTAAIKGTQDVIIPVIASCGTNLVVFTPIAFMGGIVGQFMIQFGLSVVYATLFSLLASFTLTPMLCGLLLKPEKKDKKQNFLVRNVNKGVSFLLDEYKIIFNLMFKIPIIWCILVVVSIVASFSLAGYIGNEFIPVSDEDRIQVNLTLPQGSTIEETSRVTQDIEKIAKEYPEVKSILSVLGENGKENSRVILHLKDKEERSRSDNDLIKLMTPKAAQIPNTEIEFVRGEGGGGGEADVSINFQGPDYDKLIEYSEKARTMMSQTGYFRSLTSSYKSPRDEVQFIPDLKKLEQYGVKGAQLGPIIRAAIYGDENNIYKEDGEEYDIRVELDENYKESSEALKNINILTNFGLIPITELGELKTVQAVPNIWRRDRNRIIQLNGYLSKSTSGVVQGELVEKFKELKLEDRYTYKFVGNAENQEESSQEIGKAFGLAIILTFMLLVAILNSFVHPITISSSIITSFGGVFILLFFANSSINIASMLGLVMLVGLVVNNAILFIDETEVLLKKDTDMDIKDALWQAMENKFRAILMTSIAIIAGALPQTWSPDLAKASMGLVIIGGVTASIVYTFILTPIVYWYIERMRRFASKRA